MKNDKTTDVSMLSVGSKVFYPTHGAGTIKGKKKIEFQGEKKEYFEFKFIDAQLTVSTPVENIGMLGVRPIMTLKAIRKFIEILKKKPAKKPKQSEYNDLIKHIQELDTHGDVTSYVEIVQLCNAVQKKREKEGRLIPVSIKKHRKTAMDLIIGEIAVAEDKTMQEAAIMFNKYTELDIDTDRY